MFVADIQHARNPAQVYADKTIGLNSLNVQFTGNAWGTNAASYYYRGDFDYPSGIDWEGDGENTPANFYSMPGVYSVCFSVGNSAGQVACALRTGYITVLSNVFATTPLTGAAPRMTIRGLLWRLILKARPPRGINKPERHRPTTEVPAEGPGAGFARKP